MFDPTTIVRENILQLKPYSSARDEFTSREGTFLDANENPFGDFNRYPDPYQRKLKSKLSEYKNVPAKNIFIGNGSDEIIDLSFRIFCEPGKDKALSFSPGYGMYQVSADINNVELIQLPLDENFQINQTALLPYFKDANLKLIFICSPNNPTGNCMLDQDIQFIVENFKGIVIIDEAYIDFTEKASWLNRVEQYPNLVISQTFSKAWGLAAARVGVGYMSEELLFYYNKVKAPYNVSLLNQQTAIRALADKSVFDDHLKVILKEKSKIKVALSNLEMIKKIYPSDANFFLVEVDDANTIYEELVGRKIIVRNRTTLVKNCLRITIGSELENTKLINALTIMNNSMNGSIEFENKYPIVKKA